MYKIQFHNGRIISKERKNTLKGGISNLRKRFLKDSTLTSTDRKTKSLSGDRFLTAILNTVPNYIHKHQFTHFAFLPRNVSVARRNAELEAMDSGQISPPCQSQFRALASLPANMAAMTSDRHCPSGYRGKCVSVTSIIIIFTYVHSPCGECSQVLSILLEEYMQ